jgi:hypothetical protein
MMILQFSEQSYDASSATKVAETVRCVTLLFSALSYDAV